MIHPKIMAAGLLFAATSIAHTGCSDDASTTALFSLDAPREDFYALPFPNDLRRTDDNKLDLSAFPANSFLVELYRDAAAASLDGFGLNQTMFVRFSDAIDPATLPTIEGSRRPDASVALVNIDKKSPHYLEQTPIITTFRPESGDTIGANSLAVRPYPGFPLDEGTTYALLITDQVRAADGSAIAAAPDFVHLRNGEGAPAKALERYAPLREFIGSDVKRIIDAAVFTTQTFSQYPKGIRAAIAALPVPTATLISNIRNVDGYTLFEGTYQAPNFQRGAVPYRNSGGDIALDNNGVAMIAGMESMRFSLTIPNGDVPLTGFPLVIVHHGTGGDFRSAVGDGTAFAFAAQGMAMITTDQVLHGPRNPGGDPQIDFYNFANPAAARDNAMQGYGDAFSTLRFALGQQIVDGPRTLRIDPARVMFFGHSQGGQTGPGFVAFEPSIKGAVFSGTGGVLYLSLLLKTKPVDIPTIVATAIRDEPLDNDNPTLAMVQMYMERADPVNYAPLMIRNPISTPRSVMVTEGFGDSYTPNLATESFATALGADLVQSSSAVPLEGLTLRGRKARTPPFSGYTATDGPLTATSTAAIGQYKPPAGSDGHFVVFRVNAAKKQASEFLGSLSKTGTATIVAP
jgi:hypothetical protein